MIREIRHNDIHGQYRLKILTEHVKKPRIVAEFSVSQGAKRWYDDEQVNFETAKERLIKLANEILSHFHGKAKLAEWKPTFDDLEKRILEQYGRDGIYTWTIDTLRDNRILAKRVFSFLQEWDKLSKGKFD